MGKHKHNRRDFLGKLAGLGCASLSVTPLLSGITNLGLVNAAAVANRPAYSTTASNGYKALVCIMLSGGNDSYNMLIPRGTSEYTEYAERRTNMAIPQADILPINPLVADGKDYGLHPSMTNVQSMFEAGNLAFIANVGALVQPTTVASFNADQNLPLGLFSHSDQRTHWQTSVPQDRDALGWGGRLADIMHTNNANQDISMNISLNGINVFQQGATVREYAIERSGTGSVQINGATNNNFYNTMKRQTLDNILDDTYVNILEQAYAGSVRGANGNSIQFGSAIASGTPFTTVFPDTQTGERLEMVAKTIAARGALNVSNQTFFVSMGGYDTHNNMILEHAELMQELDEAVGAFYNCMVELGVENDVVGFTMSDFARKLVSNGDGSDHAWGGHAFAFGGSITGKKIYGAYPDLFEGNSLETGNGGRIIPTTSCDEYFADLALWFGASSSDLNQILPNINNFWTPSGTTGPLGLFV